METIATSKGQIVIPAPIRRKLGIKKGTRIRIELKEDRRETVLKPITRDYIQSLRGSLHRKGLLKALAAEKRRAREL